MSNKDLLIMWLQKYVYIKIKTTNKVFDRLYINRFKNTWICRARSFIISIVLIKKGVYLHKEKKGLRIKCFNISLFKKYQLCNWTLPVGKWIYIKSICLPFPCTYIPPYFEKKGGGWSCIEKLYINYIKGENIIKQSKWFTRFKLVY